MTSDEKLIVEVLSKLQDADAMLDSPIPAEAANVVRGVINEIREHISAKQPIEVVEGPWTQFNYGFVDAAKRRAGS
jgi:hypothetical protein